MCRGINQVGLAPVLGAPLRDRDREGDVDHQRHDGDECKPDVELDSQDAQHQHQLDEGGHDAVERIGDERLDAFDAAFDIARHAASLALQVKAQAHAMQVLEGLQGDGARRALRGLGKHQLTQLAEHRSQQPQAAIGQQQANRHHQQRLRTARLNAKRIHHVLEQHRHAHVRDLGTYHQQQCSHHAPFVGPQIGQQALEGFSITRFGFTLGFARACGERGFLKTAHGGQLWDCCIP
ncbi:hypothetical protein D3C71_1537650 [compost metagenome]